MENWCQTVSDHVRKWSDTLSDHFPEVIFVSGGTETNNQSSNISDPPAIAAANQDRCSYRRQRCREAVAYSEEERGSWGGGVG